MTKPTCSIEDCGRSHMARGFCNQHYKRWKKHGDPHAVATPEGPAQVDPWTKIDKRGPDDCWLWTGGVCPDGYGRQRIQGVDWIASRWVLTQKLGRDLLPEEVTRHTCDNPPCCNPAHLIVGNTQDNVSDRVARGRSARGERPDAVVLRGAANAGAKLTDDQVRDIRAQYAGGARQVDLAADFNVHQTLISLIVRRVRWAHVA